MNKALDRLKIAYDAKRAFLNYRGLGNYCRNLLGQLALYYPDNQYILCTPQNKHLYPQLDKAPFETILPQGVWNIFPTLWRRRGIGTALSDRQIDIYHGLSQELPKDIDNAHCKKVVTMHDAIFIRYPEQYSVTYRHSFIQRNKYACQKADLIIAISEQTKRDYIEFFGVEEERIKVIYQGCNELYWQPITKEHCQAVKQHLALPEEYILCVGALEERKNQVRLIKSLAAAHISLPLVLVGNGNRKHIREVKKTATKYNVDTRIISNVTASELPAIYKSAKVFAYPSLFEGFGIPILEAARCETPIVTSRGICFEEIVGSGAAYINPQDIEEIGNAISTYINSAELCQQNTSEALLQTEKFRAEKIAANMMEAYMSLV